MSSRISALDTLADDDVAGAQSLYGGSATAAPPVITSQPASRTVTAGQSTSFSVSVSSSLAVTYQWRNNGTAISGATAATLTFSSVTTADAGGYAVVVANSAGSVTSDTATLAITSSPATPTTPTIAAPLITSQPADLTVVVGASATLVVAASGTAPTYQWKKDGANLAGATSARFTIAPARVFDAGSYVVLVANSAGAVSSTPARLTVIDVPVITSPPTAQAVAAGERASFSVVAISSTPMTYQWLKDDVEIENATAATLVLYAAGPTDAGNYTVRVSNADGSVFSQSVALVVKFSRLLNLSARGYVPERGNMALGFHVRGAGTKRILIRAAGPALALFGVSNALVAPKLEVIAQDTASIVVSNSGWGGTSTLSSAFGTVGAFPFAADSNDAAVLVTVGARGYTARVTSTSTNAEGITLAEIYDTDSTGAWSTRIVNLSTLGFVGVGETALTTGFVIGGNVSKRVLVRAVGPGLAALGVPDLLLDPQLALQRAGQVTPLANNDDWQNTGDIRAAFTAVGAFALPAGSKDSALLVSLEPGAYTVTISGAYGMMGNSLVELYDLDP
jgi:hypothetical protein